ncbi:hypothetical protein NXS15_02735 [Mycoplasma sp. CSL7475-4]|uniref:hypothetical protein n=1 Tax=Mycoplasma sp. CSL7475-4 TaxID=2973942 RepID=UPI00216AE747|nr:hypothetical protein [Mycoplasma sp. CSL7475-4]MCS4537029.1 hypothetical protein [Mycoplasma sp. CSL7475-4]
MKSKNFKRILLLSIFLAVILLIPFIEQFLVRVVVDHSSNNFRNTNFYRYLEKNYSGIVSVTVNFFRNFSETMEFYKNFAGSSASPLVKIVFFAGVLYGFIVIASVFIWIFLTFIYSIILFFKKRFTIPSIIILITIVVALLMILSGTNLIKIKSTQNPNQIKVLFSFLHSQFISIFVLNTLTLILSILGVFKYRK